MVMFEIIQAYAMHRRNILEAVG